MIFIVKSNNLPLMIMLKVLNHNTDKKRDIFSEKKKLFIIT